MQRKRRPGSLIDPLKVILGLLGILILSVIILLTINVNKDRTTYTTAQQSLKIERHKLKNIKAHGNLITTGKFDLTKHEQVLSHQYSSLTAQVYGGLKHPQDLIKQRSKLIKYFGQTGYSQIKSQVIGNNNGKRVIIPTKNSQVSVTFSNYDPAKNCVDVTVFTKYDTQYGKRITYINTTYSFKESRAIYGSAQMATVDKEDE